MGVYFYALGHNPILLRLLLLQLFSIGLWEFFSSGPRPQTYPHQRGVCVLVCLKHFLTFWHYKMLQAHRVYFLPQS